MKFHLIRKAAGSVIRLNSGLSHRRKLAHSAIFNLLGQGIPLLAALYAIPVMIFALGADRFGIFTLIWVVAGYFGLFDLGIGRAITKLVAEKVSSQHSAEVPAIFWTALTVIFMSSLVGTLLLFTSSPWLIEHLLKTSDGLKSEALPALQLLAICLPVVICTAALSGFLEALHRFGSINLIKIPMGIFSFIGPLLVLPFSHDLLSLTSILLAGRIIEFAGLLTICFAAFPALRDKVKFTQKNIRSLLSFGGWITVSNIIGPILSYLDRFFISALISVSAITYYAAPFSLIIKLAIIPAALVGVLFPTFVRHLLEDRLRAAQLFQRSTRYVIYSTFPIVLILFTFAHEVLTMWIDETFARHSTPVVQWLLVGIFMNGLAQVPVALIHGNGRPELVAKLHLAELPLYLLALLVLLKTYGITGVAIASMARMAVDAIVLLLISRRLLPEATPAIRQCLQFLLVMTVTLLIAAAIDPLSLKALFCMAALLLFGGWAWTTLKVDERKIARRLVATVLRLKA
ncbi:MAG: flippase [Gallionella sp.]|nr:flippase [Gallionella sp.]MDD4946742.1 flippase [Gallionella sp.]